MAIGDTSDFFNRLKAVLPRWCGDYASAPLISGLLTGAASVLAQCYALLAYVRLQTRILTSSDGWLDLTAQDFFGAGLPRRQGEQDSSYRMRIVANILRERATRNGMIATLTSLTGRAPIVFEPARPQDAFCLGQGGLGTARLGSYLMPYQALVTAYRPTGAGGANVAGLGTPFAGLGSSYMALPSSASLGGSIQDADIYAAIDATKVAGTTIWTQITS